MTLLSYLIAFGHFGSEVLIYRSAQLTGPVISPVIVACECPSALRPVRTRSPTRHAATSLLWMLREYEYYVKV